MASITQQIAAEVLPAVATAVCTGVASVVLLALKDGFAWLRTKVKSARWQAAITKVENASAKAVRDVSAGMSKSLKEKLADGKLDPLERMALRDEAVAKTRQLLGHVNAEEICKVLGYGSKEEMTKALEAEIENAVFYMKLQKSAAAVATPTVNVSV